jgi:hypothetical protein
MQAPPCLPPSSVPPYSGNALEWYPYAGNALNIGPYLSHNGSSQKTSENWFFNSDFLIMNFTYVIY